MRKPKVSDFACRICGWLFNKPSWGADGHTPTFWICDCCGAETGVNDLFIQQVLQYRAKWIKNGCKWFNPSSKPDNWSLDDHIGNVSSRYGKDVELVEEPYVETAQIGLLSVEVIDNKEVGVPAAVFFIGEAGEIIEDSVFCSDITCGEKNLGESFLEPKWLVPGEYQIKVSSEDSPDMIYDLHNLKIEGGRGLRQAIKFVWQPDNVSRELLRIPRLGEFAAALSWVLQALEVNRRIAVTSNPTKFVESYRELEPKLNSTFSKHIPVFREKAAEIQYLADQTNPLKGLLFKSDLYKNCTTTGSIDWIDYLIGNGHDKEAECILRARLKETCVSRGVVDRWRLKSLCLAQNRLEDVHLIITSTAWPAMYERGDSAFEFVFVLEERQLFHKHVVKDNYLRRRGRSRLGDLISQRDDFILDSEIIRTITKLNTSEYFPGLWRTENLEPVLAYFDEAFECDDCWLQEAEVDVVASYGLLHAIYGCKEKGEKHLRRAIEMPDIGHEYKQYLLRYLTRLLLSQKRTEEAVKEIAHSTEGKQVSIEEIRSLVDIFINLPDYQFDAFP